MDILKFWAPGPFLIQQSSSQARRSKLRSAGLFRLDNSAADLPVLQEPGPNPAFDSREITTELIFGKQKLRAFFSAIHELRLRCGQQDDLTTDPRQFIAANTLKDRRVAAVLIRRNLQLEAYVLFIEHCKLGIGLGLLSGGVPMGESLVTGPETLRLQYVHLATQAMLRHWRIHGVSVAVNTSLNRCIDVMGPAGNNLMLCGRTTQHRLPLQSTYRQMLASLGPRTRRSLAGKRQQLEKNAHVTFLPVLEPALALEGMLRLQSRSMPHRSRPFYQARYQLLLEKPEFFSMGMLLPDGTWLSILSGWRLHSVTYVDFQMNDMHFKKESLSAVMRAFMLEHEIDCKQTSIDFVGGTSLLLRRYCQPIEPCSDIFLSRPCLRASLFKAVIPRMKGGTIYERIGQGDAWTTHEPGRAPGM